MLTLGNPLSLTPADFRTSITRTAVTQVIAENTPTTVPGCTPPNEAGERFYWNGSEWAKVQPHQRCTNDSNPLQPGVPPPAVNQIIDGKVTSFNPGSGGITTGVIRSYRTLQWEQRRLLYLETQRDAMRLLALAPTLPICPGSERGECYRGPKPNFEDLLLPPGSFTVFGVPFHISELKSNGRFEKNGFVPDEAQRFKLDMAILTRSQYEFRKKDLGLPIQYLLDRDSDMLVSFPGFSLNPVEPTPEEMTQTGGAQRWVNRGGYFISRKVITGQVPVTGYGDSKGFGINVCASIRCACPQDNAAWDSWRTRDLSKWEIEGGLIPADQVVSWMPSCIGAAITEKGGLSIAGGTAAVWNAYVAVNPANPNEYYLHIVIKPEVWTSKMAGWIGEQLAKLGKLFCESAPAVQQQLTTAMAEVCIDKQQKPCTKGTPNCTCTKPPAAAQASVGVFNVWSNHWCNKFMEEYGDRPPQEAPDPNAATPQAATPQVPPELAPEPTMKWWHWGLLIGAGAGVGYFLLRRR